MRGSMYIGMYVMDQCNCSVLLFVCRAARNTWMTGIQDIWFVLLP